MQLWSVVESHLENVSVALWMCIFSRERERERERRRDADDTAHRKCRERIKHCCLICCCCSSMLIRIEWCCRAAAAAVVSWFIAFGMSVWYFKWSVSCTNLVPVFHFHSMGTFFLSWDDSLYTNVLMKSEAREKERRNDREKSHLENEIFENRKWNDHIYKLFDWEPVTNALL